MHTGKYQALWAYLDEQRGPELKLSFSDVERILGFPLPASSRKHLPHWYGYAGSAVARAIRDAGWKATKVDLNAQTVVFVRT